MKTERIDIIVPDDVLAENPAKVRRLEQTRAKEKADRVPVMVGESQYLMLAARGVTVGEYIRSPEENLRQQILNRKWRIENVRDDQPVPTKGLQFRPDLGVLRGTEFPMEITFQADGPPKCVHPLRELEDIDRLTVPPPDGALHAKYIDWWRKMRVAAESLDVRVNGQKLAIEVTLSQGGGPLPAAFALAGGNLFLWSIEDPQRTHRLMDIVTQSHINCIRFFDELVGRKPNHTVWMGADTAEMFSPAMFRDFVAPYCIRVWEAVKPPERPFHMCGKIDHLLEIIRDELKITHQETFGSVVDRNKLADAMAGRVLLQGGPEPLLISRGSRQEIIDECVSYIRIVGRAGGFILSTGGGPVPGTPTEHFKWMIEASEQAAS